MSSPSAKIVVVASNIAQRKRQIETSPFPFENIVYVMLRDHKSYFLTASWKIGCRAHYYTKNRDSVVCENCGTAVATRRRVGNRDANKLRACTRWDDMCLRILHAWVRKILMSVSYMLKLFKQYSTQKK